MRILFDQGVCDLRNKGNIALTQVAVRRISQMWPQGSLEIMTSAPQILRLYCPNAIATNPNGQLYPRRLLRRIPMPILRLMLEAREAVWHRWPTLGPNLKSLLRMKGERKKSMTGVANSWQHFKESDGNGAINQVKGRDLFIATGAQYMSDACRNDALRVLERLQAANKLGIPTAMVGQGLGPFDDPELHARVHDVLPLVDLIFVRDRLSAPSLLNSLGVDPKRVIFTGDDAIELAFEARTNKMGTAIGTSLRVAHYTQISDTHIEMVRQVLRQATLKYRARLLTIPISHSIHEQDDRVLGQLVSGQPKKSVGLWRFDCPKQIVKKVGCCRIVVTGTFHAAVFALAQGIPAVGLVQSGMYVDKFEGLADQFGPGCQVIYLDDRNLPDNLSNAIDKAWKSAEHFRSQLLEAAVHQISLGQAAYRRLYELVESRKRRIAVGKIANDYA